MMQGLSEPFQEQYSKLQRNVILTMVVRACSSEHT